MTNRTHVTTTEVSFIVPALNEATMIVGLLDSIQRLQQTSEIRVCEVIVVDSGSTDSTAELARAAGCRVIDAPPGNVSVSRNLGASVATGNTLAFVDADCELPSNWLTLCVTELLKDDVAASGMNMAAPQASASWVERTWFQIAHQSETQTGAADVSWLASFNLVVPTQQFHRIGGFDESLITCEDVDLGYRLLTHARLRQVHDIGVIHHGESKDLAVFRRREAWRARGGWRLLHQHGTTVRELISCLIPFGVTGSLVCGLAASWWNPMAPVVGLLPLAAMALRTRPPIRQLPAALLLLAVYYFARCQGMLWPAGRVERTGGQPSLPLTSDTQSQTSNDIMSLTPQASNVD